MNNKQEDYYKLTYDMIDGFEGMDEILNGIDVVLRRIKELKQIATNFKYEKYKQ